MGNIPIEIGSSVHQAPSETAHLRHHGEYMSLHRTLLAHITNPENISKVEVGRKCGDGRYEGLDGKTARFGADGGYVLGLLSLNRTRGLGLTPIQIVDAVVDCSEGQFSFHSDEAAEKSTEETDDSSKIGCGHIAKAMLPENAEKYLVEPTDVKTATAYMKELAVKKPNTVEMVILRGQHREKGVIINTGKEKKIRHGDGLHQWFVIGEARDREYADALFGRLLEKLPILQETKITPADFREVLDRQTAATAGILAHGLPVFIVNVDGELPHVDRAPSF